MQNRSFEKLFPGISAIENPSAVHTPGRHTPGRLVAARESKQDQAQVNEKLLRNRVLLVGSHHELTLYRAEVLRHAGFRVHTPESSKRPSVSSNVAISMLPRSATRFPTIPYKSWPITFGNIARTARLWPLQKPIASTAGLHPTRLRSPQTVLMGWYRPSKKFWCNVNPTGQI